MDRAVALRRCSVTGYIPSIPRGHGHISSSSRFPVPHTPGLPSRGTRAGTRNNGARVGTGPPVRAHLRISLASVSGLPRRRDALVPAV